MSNDQAKRQKTEAKPEVKSLKQILKEKPDYFAFLKFTGCQVRNQEIILTTENFDKSILKANPEFKFSHGVIIHNQKALSAEDDSPYAKYPFVVSCRDLPQNLNVEVQTEEFYLIQPLFYYQRSGWQYLEGEDSDPNYYSFLCLDKDLKTFFVLQICRSGEHVYVIRWHCNKHNFELETKESSRRYARRGSSAPYEAKPELKSDAKRTIMWSYHAPTEYQLYRHRYPGELYSTTVVTFKVTPSPQDFVDAKGIPYVFGDGGILESYPGQWPVCVPVELKEQFEKDEKAFAIKDKHQENYARMRRSFSGDQTSDNEDTKNESDNEDTKNESDVDGKNKDE